MEVYVYADEVDVRLHEGSFLITTTNNTLKSFFKEKNHIRLQPQNSFMQPIIVPTCSILGKVAGVFRKL